MNGAAVLRRLAVVGLVACLVGTAIAGTTPIHIDTEQGGDIDVGVRAAWDGVYENSNGAMFWTGSNWVTNHTAAHRYFTDLSTGLRIKEYTTTAIDGSATGSSTPSTGYTVVVGNYSYAIPAATGTALYQYTARQYRITQPDGLQILLRSRGSGNGTAQPYFDVYMTYPDGAGVAALRGDTAWFLYPGLTVDEAAAIGDETTGLAGNLPTCAPAARAQYWFDYNGGSDMGGVTYQSRMSCLTAAIRTGIGSSFVTSFSLKFTDGVGQLQDLSFTPRIVSESLVLPPGTAAVDVPSNSTLGLVVLSVLVAGFGLWRQRRQPG